MTWERTKYLLLAATVVISQSVLWRLQQDSLVSFYLFVAMTVLNAKIFSWPDPNWFGARHLKRMREAWGTYRLEQRTNANDPVNALRTKLQVKNYFAATIYSENTERLCNDLSQSLSFKVALYGFIVLALLFLGPDKRRGISSLEIILGIAVSLGPILWDIVLCDRQSYWNREIHEP